MQNRTNNLVVATRWFIIRILTYSSSRAPRLPVVPSKWSQRRLRRLYDLAFSNTIQCGALIGNGASSSLSYLQSPSFPDLPSLSAPLISNRNEYLTNNSPTQTQHPSTHPSPAHATPHLLQGPTHPALPPSTARQAR